MEKFNQSEVVEVSETIKEIPGFSRYLCDIEKGKIYRKATETQIGKWLEQSPNAIGYVATTLVADDGKKVFMYLHEIVMSSTIEHPKSFWTSKNLEIDHRDRNKSNNNFYNLQLVTKSKNHENKESRKPHRTLNKEEVHYIMDSFKKWEGQKIEFYQLMAEQIGCVWQTIQYTILGYSNQKKLITD